MVEVKLGLLTKKDLKAEPLVRKICKSMRKDSVGVEVSRKVKFAMNSHYSATPRLSVERNQNSWDMVIRFNTTLLEEDFASVMAEVHYAISWYNKMYKSDLMLVM